MMSPRTPEPPAGSMVLIDCPRPSETVGAGVGVGAQVDAVPGDSFLKKMCRFKFDHGTPPMLTQYGRDLLKACADHKILVDVTHCWPDVRRQVYAEIGGSSPVIGSSSSTASGSKR